MRNSNAATQSAVSAENEAEIRRLKHEIRVKEETHETDTKIFSSRVQ